ncbi:argininosuccinate lyase [Candidatus Neomarinimicrobiota bacterium]
MKPKVWQERFSGELDPHIEALNRSITFDHRLGPYDVRASMVWAEALHRCGTLKEDDLAAITKGLQMIGQELGAATFEFRGQDEDIHMAIERRLGDLIGAAAGRLHTGRSRNDQVATDLRLYSRDQMDQLVGALIPILEQLVAMAEEQVETAFPGHTHLQQAEVISLGQILLAHAWRVKGDVDLLTCVKSTTSTCPLGAGALGGSPIPVDREWISRDLGFNRPTENSIEAVESRDFVLDLLYAMARLGLHLSSLAEDFIIWNSQEFGFLTLDDSVATGSSLLAHKKNPDVFELIRGKCGRLVGHLTGFMTTMKGLPSGYNKDLQEDKEPLFDAVDTLQLILPALAVALKGVTFTAKRIAEKLSPTLKTERIVRYLTAKEMPFREAYTLAGSLVRESESRGIELHELPLELMQSVTEAIGADLKEELSAGWKIPEEGVLGGSNKESLSRQIGILQGWLRNKAG